MTSEVVGAFAEQSHSVVVHVLHLEAGQVGFEGDAGVVRPTVLAHFWLGALTHVLTEYLEYAYMHDILLIALFLN